MSIENYSTTAASNTSINGQAVTDSTAVDNVDNLIREIMADMADLYQNKLYPVGALYISTVSTNPATLLGFGTWAAYAAGRSLVGVGTSNTADAVNWTAEEEDGRETTGLVTANMPSHTHSFSATTSSNGSHSHTYTGQVLAGNGSSSGITFSPIVGTFTTGNSTNAAGAHTHTVSGTSGSAGSGTRVTTLSPGKAVYIWKRTA